MKRIFITPLVITLSMLMACLGIVHPLADSTKTYIGGVKVAMGGSAENDLTNEGFTILSDKNGNPVDLNAGAGGDKWSQGDKKVLLGYKTTADITGSITDLAVMNMEGSYRVQKYDVLMERYAAAQIRPYTDKLLVAVNEYRYNIRSKNEENRRRAEYVRAALNKFTDDDCGGAPLGDLLLNETKYEMGDEAYDALSEADKKEHCDILTLFAQADGQIMLVIWDLITRAADTADDSWIDRFTGMTYDDLLDSYDMTPTDARKKAARDFDDDARAILRNWEDFRTMLIGAYDDIDDLKKKKRPDLDSVGEKVGAIDENSGEEQIADAAPDLYAAYALETERIGLAGNVAVLEYLKSIRYDGRTLLDFFTRSSSEAAEDITKLYPLAASLSPGQRAGLEFLSLRELVMTSGRDAEYSVGAFEDIGTVSVYDGVDREIYSKGGVALTDDTLRTRVLELQKEKSDGEEFGNKTFVLWAVTSVFAMDFIDSACGSALQIPEIRSDWELTMDYFAGIMNSWVGDAGKLIYKLAMLALDIKEVSTPAEQFAAASALSKGFTYGFSAASIIFTSVTSYMTWQELKDYYKVDFSPIPHYMVDNLTVTYYNERGEKLVKDNHVAIYEAVKCNRRENDKNHKALGDCADMNGDVGRQWLALYACRDYKNMQPILADSLRAVVGSDEIPADHDGKGIHMFGSETAFNLNSKLYDWNTDAKSVFVYFMTDSNASSDGAATTGSSFSAGLIALTAILGAGVGAAVTAVAIIVNGKRKSSKRK